MLENSVLRYMARENRPLFGGHLQRDEPLTDWRLQKAIEAGFVEQAGREGYVLTDKGWTEAAEQSRRCPACGQAVS